MKHSHNAQPMWRKSSYSGVNGNCVEVATPLPRSIDVRDSKDPQGPVLTFTSEAWSAFLGTVDEGAYDL
ncbi:DUF397 domain-containing protein [Streptomyces varsoviensis]|uniref:DUF397 domain-containing protein n=1 Tax=Streptomyces varsoviensis TaxID=67373 RepID=UPI0033D3CA5C